MRSSLPFHKKPKRCIFNVQTNVNGLPITIGKTLRWAMLKPSIGYSIVDLFKALKHPRARPLEVRRAGSMHTHPRTRHTNKTHEHTRVGAGGALARLKYIVVGRFFGKK